jgi:hypothetical protein
MKSLICNVSGIVNYGCVGIFSWYPNRNSISIWLLFYKIHLWCLSYFTLLYSVMGLVAQVFMPCRPSHGGVPCSFCSSLVGMVPLVPRLVSTCRVLGKWGCRVHLENSSSEPVTICWVPGTIGRVPVNSAECLGVDLTNATCIFRWRAVER